MAKINMIIRAFEAVELHMLNDLVEREAKLAEQNSKTLPPSFQELRESIGRAIRYVDNLADQDKNGRSGV
jgi:hypothetical protein